MVNDSVANDGDVVCDSLSVHFGTTANAIRAVDAVTMRFAGRQSTSVIGASGCGKTTLLKTIAGLIEPTAGTIGVPHQRIGFVFQSPNLLPWLTVRNNVALAFEIGDRSSPRLDRSSIDQAITRVLNEVGLRETQSRYPDQLSGGMQMRVSIARAMVRRPTLLLLDEPFAALDEGLRDQLGGLVNDLCRRHAITSVLVTHNLDEAIRMGDRVVLMDRGRVVDEVLGCRCGEISAFEMEASSKSSDDVRSDREVAETAAGLRRTMRRLRDAAEAFVVVMGLMLGMLGSSRSALATDSDVLVGMVPPSRAGIRKSRPVGVVVDDQAAILQGDWAPGNRSDGYIDRGYHISQAVGSRAEYLIIAPRDGHYELRMHYVAHRSLGDSVPVAVRRGGSETKRLVSLRSPPVASDTSFDGGSKLIGRYRLSRDEVLVVTMHHTESGGVVCADAIVLRPANP